MRRLLSIPAVMALLATSAHAHERWVEHELLRPVDRSLFDMSNGVTLLAWTCAAAVFGIIAAAAQRPTRYAKPTCPLRTGTLRVALGVTLVLFACDGRFLAPDLVVDSGPLARPLLAAAAGLGLVLVLGALERWSSWAIAILFSAVTLVRPFAPFDGQPVAIVDVLANLEVLGIAAYLGLSARAVRDPESQPRSNSAAVAALRLALGLEIVLLGVGKFLHPELFVAVIQNYPSFFAPFGSLSPEVITLAASLVETLLGMLLIAGVLPRLVASAFVGILVLTGFLFAAEVLAHLPLIATGVILAIEGRTGRLCDLLAMIGARPASTDLAPAPCKLMAERRASFGIGAFALMVLSMSVMADSQAVSEPQPALPGGASDIERVTGEQGHCRFLVDVGQGAGGLQEFFSITTRVVDAATGIPVEGVELTVDVTMPHHGHGMTTAPVTSATGLGLFRTEGCKLHMLGRWQISLVVVRGAEILDRADLPLLLSPPHDK